MLSTETIQSRFDQEITESERLVVTGRHDDALKMLAKVLSRLHPAAELFYTASRIKRMVDKLKGPDFPQPQSVSLSEDALPVLQAGQDFFYKCLGMFNDKVRRDRDALASGSAGLPYREAFAVATLRLLEQTGHNFRLTFKTNQSVLDQKIVADTVEFD